MPTVAHTNAHVVGDTTQRTVAQTKANRGTHRMFNAPGGGERLQSVVHNHAHAIGDTKQRTGAQTNATYGTRRRLNAPGAQTDANGNSQENN